MKRRRETHFGREVWAVDQAEGNVALRQRESFYQEVLGDARVV